MQSTARNPEQSSIRCRRAEGGRLRESGHCTNKDRERATTLTMTNEPPGSGQTDPYAALRHGPYRQFLFGRAIALVGGQMQTAAVGWAVYVRTGSMLALGFIGLVQIVPVLLLFLPAGHAADRYSRRTILLLGQGLTLACSLALAALFYGKGPPLLVFAFLFLLGVLVIMRGVPELRRLGRLQEIQPARA